MNKSKYNKINNTKSIYNVIYEIIFNKYLIGKINH